MFSKKKLTEVQNQGVERAEKILKKYIGAYLYDVTGFGKSIQAMELACNKTKDNGRILYICPAAAAPQIKEYWETEMSPGRRILIIEPYSQIVKPHTFKALMQGNYDFAVIDEAHRVKGLMTTNNKHTLQFFQEKDFSILTAQKKKYVLQAYATFAILNRCKSFFFMSATPLVNSLLDLYPFLRMCKHPLAAHGMYAYLDRWSEKVTRTPFGTKWEGLKDEKLFAKALSDIAFGREHKDETDPNLKVPEPDEFFAEFPLPEEIRLGDSYIENKLLEIGLDINQISPKKLSNLIGEVPGFESLSRFREAQGFAKVPKVVNYVKRLYKDKRSNQKIILWCYHKQVARKYSEELKALKMPNVLITGDILPKKRLDVVKYVNTLDKCVAIVTLSAASENFNFNTFFHAVWAEYDWTKKTLDQSKGRILRKGMKKKSTFHFLLFDSGVESRLWEIVLSKTKMIKGALSL